jgi:esterase/lipase superfamily enzyme
MMVHSMGHRVLKHMMLEMKENHVPFPDLFNEIILIAADIEFDIFEKGESFDKLIELGKRVHIYFHEKDRVLDISKFTKNFSNRLGRYGRKRIDPMQIDVRDANVTKTKDDANVGFEENKLNHWYYYSSTEVVEDIIEVFKGKNSKYTVSK